jgi:hypothetical protein
MREARRGEGEEKEFKIRNSKSLPPGKEKM